jgi:hypothetical protein
MNRGTINSQVSKEANSVPRGDVKVISFSKVKLPSWEYFASIKFMVLSLNCFASTAIMLSLRNSIILYVIPWPLHVMKFSSIKSRNFNTIKTTSKYNSATV